MFALTETHSHSQRHLTEQLPSVKSPTNRTARYLLEKKENSER